jgi:catechol 2,3-dioxygenase-like lactoylglutathione lyase family enzyme
MYPYAARPPQEESAVHKIRHIALFAKDQETTVEFYKKTFGMYEVARPAPSEPGQRRGIFLSDGYINLAILPWSEGRQEGIHHFGFEVEDIYKTEAAAMKSGARRGIDLRPKDGRFAEAGIVDPTGTGVDLSTAGWRTAPIDKKEKETAPAK